LAGVAKVPVSEPVEEGETSKAVKPGRHGGNTHNAEVMIESQSKQRNPKIVDQKRTRIGATQGFEYSRGTTTKEAVIFVQNQVETDLA
jgi:hypothetical protein